MKQVPQSRVCVLTVHFNSNINEAYCASLIVDGPSGRSMLFLAILQYGLASLVISSECKCLEDLESASKSFGCKCDTT